MGSHFHHTEAGEISPNETQGSVWNWAWRYDLLIGLVTLGREQAFRQRIADLAQLQPGEGVLDVGCGTGTLAMEALQRVGEMGQVVRREDRSVKYYQCRHTHKWTAGFARDKSARSNSTFLLEQSCGSS